MCTKNIHTSFSIVEQALDPLSETINNGGDIAFKGALCKTASEDCSSSIDKKQEISM